MKAGKDGGNEPFGPALTQCNGAPVSRAVRVVVLSRCETDPGREWGSRVGYRLRIEGGFFVMPSLGEAPGTLRGPVGEVIYVRDHVGIMIKTGDLYSSINLTCESLDTEPPLGDEWEDISELSVIVDEQPVLLPDTDWENPTSKGALAADPAIESWRMRVSAKGRRAAFEETNRRGQRFLIQTWPAPPSPPSAPRSVSKLAQIMNRFMPGDR